MNLKQLAKSLGLSQTTVSRALNGYPEVAEATRRKVLEAAVAHNYIPNAKARSLATGRTMAVGHVIPVSASHELVNPVFSEFVAGAAEAYLLHGYDMVTSLVSDDDEAAAYRQLKARGSVDGILVHHPRRDDSRVALLREIGLPFVVHGRMSRAESESAYDWVDINNLRAFRRATEFLIDLGHRRIALVNGLEALDFAARRYEGYREALHRRGLGLDPGLIRSDVMTESYGHASAAEMLGAEDPPTAFLCSSLVIAVGVRRAIEARGLRLARDVSVIAHDDALTYLANGGEVPIFTATRSSIRLAGRLCAERLIEMVSTPGLPPRQRLLEAELTVGQSTGPAPNRATKGIHDGS